MPGQYTTWDQDDDSDLSELTDSEDEQEAVPPPSARRAPEPVAERPPSPPRRAKSTRATTQNATETSKQRVGKGALPLRRPPRSVTFSVSALYDFIKQGMIDLDPEYQRGVVWTDKKQSELINSIFDNYYVPPVVFTVLRLNDGGETRTCIDGKQRLTSICQFMDGKIPYKDSTTLRKVHYMNPKGSKRKVLTSQLQNTFKNKQITCVEYDDLKPEEEREIFQRVQLGVSLSPADRLPALNGPYADLVREMRKRIEATPGFSSYLDWGKARGKDFQALGQSVYLIVYGKTPSKADPTPTRLETFLSLVTAPKTFDGLKRDAITMVDVYCRIAGDERLGKDMRKDLTPYEFTMALYLISQHGKKLSDTQLSDAMGRMRRDFKQKFKGKKPASTATTIFKYLLTFVRKTIPELVRDLKDSRPTMGPAFDYKPEAQRCSPSVPKGRRKKERNVQKNESDVQMSDSEPLRLPTGKRKRVFTPPQTDIDQLDTDMEESDDEDRMVSKKKVRESAMGSSKPKPALAGPRKSAQTVVKRSRSSTAKPPSSAAPVASTSKAQPAVKESKPTIKGKASATVKAPTPAASAEAYNDVQTQVAQPSRPLNGARSLPERLPASTPPASSRKPLPTRVSGHQKTPSYGDATPTPPPPTPAPPPPVAFGSGAGRSPAIPPSAPRSVRQSGYASGSACATPANSPPMHYHVPAMVATPTTEAPPPHSAPAERLNAGGGYNGMGSSVIPKAPFQKGKPQAKKATLWPPLGSTGYPAGVPNPPAANANAQVQQPAAQTTASRLRAQAPEMIALGGGPSNKRGAPDHGNRPEVKRRRTGDGLAELGVGQPQNAGVMEPQRRATVHVSQAQQQQQLPAGPSLQREHTEMVDHAYNQRYTPPPGRVDNSRPADSPYHASGSLFSPPSGSLAEEEQMQGIESLSAQGRESQTHNSWH
ncbi:hypothetical protein D9619_008672 [Psilocybe cf. subviscida]|uniref:GmrSD restriction endonucleases N-terminal domain-containing protein n=1 Tax=Psilocybe cf. subviscida TaxID=2480587 RepID=A0A8H5F122_9AGAR|nr:hypothetical protein D9619_008672 [Psilocybe cf. subviscida]